MYFEECQTIEELKQAYHRLAFRHHPDKGGDNGTMQAINEEYEERLRHLATHANPEDSGSNPEEDIEIGEKYKDIISRIINLDVEIEICGRWIWVSGNTFPVREELKSAGFWWAKRKQMWYWRPPEQKYHRKVAKSIEWIRDTYGSIPIARRPLRLGVRGK
jgi:hypothetical protein